MTWGKPSIKKAYDEGEAKGASHMLVLTDTFDFEQWAVYIMPGADPRDYKPSVGCRIEECYNFALGWEAQADEFRAQHWEFEPVTANG